MKKKFMIFLLAVVMTVATAFAFVACGNDAPTDNHPADTFYTGTLSAQTYASADAAAAAFIENEIKGEATDATFVSYTYKADLTDEEVEQLDIPETEKADIDSVEKGEVKYSVANSSSVLASADDEKLYVVFIVKYKDQTIRYYAPVLNSGDALTKSYYDEVFASENFDNVTVSYVLKTNVDCKVQGMTMPIKLNMTVDLYNDIATYSYVKVNMVMDMGQLGELAGIPKTEVMTEAFSVNNTALDEYGSIYTRITESGVATAWTKSNATPSYGDDSSEVIDIENYLPAFDYSYFIKTKTGFKINSEKLTMYYNIVLEDAFDQFNGMFDDVTLGNVSATADYYVADGKLTESVQVLKCKYTVDLQPGLTATYNMTQNLKTKYTDYGTTVVEKPDDLTL